MDSIAEISIQVPFYLGDGNTGEFGKLADRNELIRFFSEKMTYFIQQLDTVAFAATGDQLYILWVNYAALWNHGLTGEEHGADGYQKNIIAIKNQRSLVNLGTFWIRMQTISRCR